MPIRQLLAAAAFIVLLLDGVWPVVRPFRPIPPIPTIGPTQHARRLELQCFAEGVAARTEEGDTILFLVPRDDSDGGLIDHRLRYAMPGRFVVKSGTAKYIASWHEATPSGRIIWSGCGGTLVER